MKKFFTKKGITLTISLLVLIVAITLVVVFTTKKPLKHDIRGSRVVAADRYDSAIENYEIEKFDTYGDFKKSKWAKASVFGGEILKDEYYNKDYFEEYKLVLVAFNYGYKGLHFTVIDVAEKNGIKNIVVAAEFSGLESEELATYYCFYETRNSLANKYSFSILELNNECNSYTYINEDNETGLFFETEANPAVFCLKTREDVESFVQQDPILIPQNYASKGLNAIADRYIEQNDIWLVRFARNEFDNLGAYRNANTIEVWLTQSNHYGFERSMENNETELICILVPKGTVIDSLSYVKYYEYEDPVANTDCVKYSFVRDEGTNLEKYSTEKVE